MTDSNKEILEVLRNMRDLLVPISACFDERLTEIHRQRAREKLEELEALLTDTRRKILPLLFDPRHLSQVAIAKDAKTTQPTVSRFINLLLERGLIDQIEDETGTQVIYVDKFNLVNLVEESK